MNSWKVWVKGLVAAAIGGASSSVTVVLADPEHFNFSTGLKKLGAVTVMGALVAVAAYLQKSPLPNGQTQHAPQEK